MINTKLKYRAILNTDSGDAKSISQALNRDNLDLNEFRITTEHRGKKIITMVGSNNMKSMLSALDDIISCQIVAEDVIR